MFEDVAAMTANDDGGSAAHITDEITAVEADALQRSIDLSLQLQAVCRKADLTECQRLIDEGAAAWYQDENTGWTALHHAADTGSAEIVQFLLKNGAVWSLPDKIGFTAGDIAYSRNDQFCYQAIYMEGVREEMLKAILEDANEGSDIDDDAETTVEKQVSTASDNKAFLKSRLRFEESAGQWRCLDEEDNAVMMGWETPIMRDTARLLCSSPEVREDSQEYAVLNIGFGLGIVDGELQKYKPTRHVIVEPHPDVLTYAKSNGWYEKPGVTFVEGTWRDFIARWEAGDIAGEFDAIYYDTFSEKYADHKAFFEHLPNLFRDETSKFSFFHGLGATSMTMYEVYTHVSEMHLKEIGLKTEWHEVDMLDEGEVTWEGVVRRVRGDAQ